MGNKEEPPHLCCQPKKGVTPNPAGGIGHMVHGGSSAPSRCSCSPFLGLSDPRFVGGPCVGPLPSFRTAQDSEYYWTVVREGPDGVSLHPKEVPSTSTQLWSFQDLGLVWGCPGKEVGPWFLQSGHCGPGRGIRFQVWVGPGGKMAPRRAGRASGRIPPRTLPRGTLILLSTHLPPSQYLTQIPPS